MRSVPARITEREQVRNMVELENQNKDTLAQSMQEPLPCGGNDPAGNRRSTIALILSTLALLVACAALILQLSSGNRDEAEPDEMPADREETEQAAATLQYRNHILPVLENVPINGYDEEQFSRDERGFIRYLDAPVGIDVSSYQGEIDWEQVSASGVEFAMIRLGLRGYTKGGISEDAMFERNIKGALAAGLDVGVYFFSQAIDPQEAEEEAAFVLERIAPYRVSYPVVFDWESISDASARTKGLGSDAVTSCAAAFCDRIAEAGYEPMIYFNMDQGYLSYRLDRLTDYAFWLAEYHDSPGFYYDFDFWQYSHSGSVPGIEGAVDLDLNLRAYNRNAGD